MNFLGDWSYWLLLVGVLAVMTGLVYAAWWALFADRSRGRRRCPRCWYDMAYAPPPGMTCPECGFTAKREAQFGATRRRYGIALGAICAAVAISLVISERATQRGITSMLPSRFMIMLLPLADNPNRGIFAELIRRDNAGRLSDANKRRLIERCVEGDWRAQPTTDEWIEKYGEYIWDVRRTLALTPELEAPLRAIPPRLDVSTRAVWPTDVPVTISVQLDDWWPWAHECRVRATPRLEGAATTTFYRAAGFRRTPYALQLPPLPEGVEEVEIEFQIDRVRLKLDRQGNVAYAQSLNADEVGDGEGVNETEPVQWEAVQKSSVKIKVKSAGAFDEVMQAAVSNDAMNQAMRQVVSGGAVKWNGGRSPVRFSIGNQSTFTKDFDDTAIGASVELLCDGEVARRLNMWWIAGTTPTASQINERNYGFEIDYENIDLLRTLNIEDDRWQMRVRSDPALALRAGTVKKYWQGEVTVPLRVLMREGDSPPRPWRVEE